MSKCSKNKTLTGRGAWHTDGRGFHGGGDSLWSLLGPGCNSCCPKEQLCTVCVLHSSHLNRGIVTPEPQQVGREEKVRAQVLAVCTRPSSKRKKDSGGYLNRVRGSDTGRPEFTGTRSPPLPVAGPQSLPAAWRGQSPPLTSIFFFKANHKTLLCVLF